MAFPSVKQTPKHLAGVVLFWMCVLAAIIKPIVTADTDPSVLFKGWSAETQAPTDGANEPSDPKGAPYNAKGDGIADDSAALQAWLDAGGTRLASGTYRITKGLTLSGDNRSLYMDNAKILADGAGITALAVSGDGASIRANIDGLNTAAYGLQITGARAVIEGGRYENYRSTTKTARGIDAATTGGITIRNNVVRNVVSVGDSTLGNGNGAARAIALHATSAATAPSVISENHIENVTGEEGDAIQILFSDGTSNPYKPGKVTLSDNEIHNVSRRFIKIQASDVEVARNRLSSDLASQPANPASAIDVIRAQSVSVINNDISPNRFADCIAVQGTQKAPVSGIEISGNTVRQAGSNKAAGIYLAWAQSPVVLDNSTYGGADILTVRTTGAFEQGNKHYAAGYTGP